MADRDAINDDERVRPEAHWRTRSVLDVLDAAVLVNDLDPWRGLGKRVRAALESGNEGERTEKGDDAEVNRVIDTLKSMLFDAKCGRLDIVELPVDVRPPPLAQKEVIRGDIAYYAGGITWADAEYDERLGAALRPIQSASVGAREILIWWREKGRKVPAALAPIIADLDLPNIEDLLAENTRLRAELDMAKEAAARELSTKAKTTLLILLAAVLRHAKVEIQQTTVAAKRVARMTQVFGMPITARTIENYFREIKSLEREERKI